MCVSRVSGVCAAAPRVPASLSTSYCYMCPHTLHTTTYVFAYYYVCVHIAKNNTCARVCARRSRVTAIYVSA